MTEQLPLVEMQEQAEKGTRQPRQAERNRELNTARLREAHPKAETEQQQVRRPESLPATEECRLSKEISMQSSRK